MVENFDNWELLCKLQMHSELSIEWSDFFIGDGCRSLTQFREELRRRVHSATYAARTQ